MRYQLLLPILTLAVLGVLGSCLRPGTTSSAEQPRGHEPWVFRSVLDQQPRMLTLAMREDFWVAYDAATGGLYKVWRDGVLFDGPVYTTAHGPQPESQGPAYLVSEQRQPWRLLQAGDTITPQVRYLGHRFRGDAVELNVLLLHAGDSIRITEQPVLRQQEGHYVLDRRFEIRGLPSGHQLLLLSNAASLMNWPHAEGGRFDITAGSDRPVAGSSHVYRVEGALRIPANGRATLSFAFHEQPMIQEPVEATDEIHPGLALIERSDCKSCHNERVKTIGPAYLSIAEKYEFTLANISQLAQKVMQGGAGVWGKQVMTAHPDLMQADAEAMVSYILSLDGEASPEAAEPEAAPMAFTLDPEQEDQGILLHVYDFDLPISEMPTIEANDVPIFSGVIPAIHATNDAAFQGLTEHFYFEIEGYLEVPEANTYLFSLASDDGSILYLDEKEAINNDGLHAMDPKEAELWLTGGRHELRLRYFQSGGGKGISLQWRKPGDSKLSVIGPQYLRHDPDKVRQTGRAVPTSELVRNVPGDQAPLQDVHPSFTLENIRPEGFEPKVGGLDFLDEDRLVVSTWDPNGSVWLLTGIREGDPRRVRVTRIASGLAEPLGLKVVDGEIYVLQKQELTQLIDHDGDGLTDEYRTVSNDWRVSANFHEFAFGLAYQDGWFYAALATAIEPGGASTNPQIPDRGKVVRISRETGALEFVAHGLRTPNGVGIGVDDQIFIADNQGDWLPASKIVHLQQDAFYGSRSVDFEGTAGLTMTPPVVWLPQDEIGNSPSQPIYLDKGPYAGQMLHGEVTHGGIKRVFVEQVNGQYQGAVFRFTQGLEAGVNRLVWGPDDKLYVGGVGNPGNWSHYGRNWFGLQRLAYNGATTFEMLAIRAAADGMEIEFTEPVPVAAAMDPASWDLQQWYYLPTQNYGGPKIDLRSLRPRSIRLSEDRKRVFLELPDLQAGHVVYVHITRPFRSDSGQDLWSTEAWYTLNQIPNESGAFASAYDYTPPAPNTLSAQEKAEGWQLLFDGKSLSGWHRYGGKGIGRSWQVQDGSITLDGEIDGWQFADGGDIVTDEVFSDFELSLEWRIEPGGNSGLMYFVQESDEYEYPWFTGPEMQILDNVRHPDGRIEKHRAGDLYDLIESRFVAVHPPMQWNRARLVVQNGKVEHWLNGYKVVAYDATSEAFRQLIAASKFAEMPAFGQYRPGRISLQDHGNRVWFRNLKIRPLGETNPET